MPAHTLASRQDTHASHLRQQIKRAVELHQAGNLKQAERLYRKVLDVRPDYFDALHMLGVVALQSGRHEYAIDLISRALRQNAGVPAAHGNLALALIQQERLQEAIASYERQISLQPECIDAYANMASAQSRLGEHHQALATCDRAIDAQPNSSLAHLARAVVLKDLERYEECLAACDRAIELQPGSATAWDKRGAALRELGRAGEALDSHARAISLQPDFALAHLHCGMVRLQSGDFERGWRSYEWRARPGGPVTVPGPEQSRWRGEQPLTGSTLLLHSEQGLGDTLQFCRYAKLAEECGARVILSVPRGLQRLMKTLSPTIRIIADTDPLPHFDWHCPLLSLPSAFKTTLTNIPAESRYLYADPERIAHWRHTLGAEGFKVGIAWQGSRLPIDVGRSFPLARFEALALIPGIRLISLQKNAGMEQLASMPPGMKVEDLGSSLDCGPDSFLDTAAIMESLDLVITSDTSIAHLAGALGRPTWVALKQIPDWRWLLGREDCPWYPSHVLFRQQRRGDWAEVFARMRAALADRIAHSFPS